MSALDFLLSFLFPRRCVSCGKIGDYFCKQCLSSIQIIETQVCPVCERPSIGGATHPGCKTKYSLDGLTSFFVYDGPIKKAIKLLKYKFVTDLAKDLVSFSLKRSDLLGGQTSERNPEKIVLTPVPLHWLRLNWRGFNQSELLGKMISARLGARFIPDLLIRKKFTKPQVELKGRERKENIAGAFSINPCYLKVNQPVTQVDLQSPEAIRFSPNQRQSKAKMVLPSHIIIFDDVWTTGATLRTCGNLLKRAGVKMVWGLTLAR